MTYHSFRNKTRTRTRTRKHKKTRKYKHLGTLRRKGGAVNGSSQYRSMPMPMPMPSTKYIPQQSENNKQYVNRANQGIKTNLQKINIQKNGFNNPTNINAISNAAQYANHLNSATNYITSDPKAISALGAAKANKIQNLSNTLLQHTANLQQSVANGEHDDTVNESLKLAKKTANNMNKIIGDKDVQKHLANTGSTLFKMGTNIFDVGTKYSTGTLTGKDAVNALGTHTSLGVQALYHSGNALMAANKAVNKNY